MKKLIVILALTLSSTFAVADTFCAELVSFSESVMDARQSGVPMSKIMELSTIKESKGKQSLVIDAYSERIWISDARKNEAIVEFGNRYALSCYKKYGV